MNNGWWSDIFGNQDYTFQNNEVLGAHLNWTAIQRNAGLIQEVESLGISLQAPNSNDIAAIASETFPADDIWGFYCRIAPSNEISLNTRDFAILSFVRDEIDPGPVTPSEWEDNRLFQISIGTYQDPEGCPIYISYRNVNDIELYWDGTAWNTTKTGIAGEFIKFNSDKAYNGFMTLSESNLTIEVFEEIISTQTWRNIAVINIGREQVFSDGGFALIGSLINDGTLAPIYYFLLSRAKGKKADSISLTTRYALPDYYKFVQKPRDKTNDFSRINFDAVLYDNRNTFLPSFRRKTIEANIADIYHTVTSSEQGRLDLVSYKYYGTTRLWWVIAMVNGIPNPSELEPGIVLRIPPIDIVNTEIVSGMGEIYGK